MALVKMDIAFHKDDSEDHLVPVHPDKVPEFIVNMEELCGHKIKKYKVKDGVIQITMDDKLAVKFFEVLCAEWGLKNKDDS